MIIYLSQSLNGLEFYHENEYEMQNQLLINKSEHFAFFYLFHLITGEIRSIANLSICINLVASINLPIQKNHLLF